MRQFVRCSVVNWFIIFSLVVATVRSQSANQVRCHWCSTVPGSSVYSPGCGDRFNASEMRICVGQSCVVACGRTKDTGIPVKHTGRACSTRPVAPSDQYPASDFDCRRMSSSDLQLSICSCSKDMCNRDNAVFYAELARLSALSKSVDSITDAERKQLGAAAVGIDIDAWMKKQASLISVEQFYKSSGSVEKQ